MDLKPQDLIVALKVLTLGPNRWNQRDLAGWLEMSLSEVNSALKRAQISGLMMGPLSKGELPRAIQGALLEFCSHGVRYCFPTERGMNVRGVLTGMGVIDPQSKDSNLSQIENLVWASPNGKIRGISISPLYKSIPVFVERPENLELYKLLALLDIFRVGRAREKKFALEMFSQQMANYLKDV